MLALNSLRLAYKQEKATQLKMSEEQLKAFIAKVQADTSLQEQLKAEGADPVSIAKAAGFTINQQDLHSAASQLSDEELESESGGTGHYWKRGYNKQGGMGYCYLVNKYGSTW